MRKILASLFLLGWIASAQAQQIEGATGGGGGGGSVTQGTTPWVTVDKWVAGAGVGLTWTSICSTEVNSIVSGNAILCTVSVANGTALDTYMDLSISLGSITSGAGSPYIGLYVYPLNQDGTTLGDGRFGSSTTAVPPSQYFGCSIPVVASATAVIVGACTGVLIPPGTFQVVLYNLAGATLAGSANVVKYRTYNK